MTPLPHERIEIEIDGELLSTLRSVAREEGRQLDSLIEEAAADLIEKRKQSGPRDHVMSAYDASHDAYASLYVKLAQ